MKRILSAALALGLGAPLILAQTTWHVATNGLDSNSGLSWEAPYLTISNAVGNAAGGDVILVSNGLYLIAAAIQISKPLIVRSVNGPELTIVQRNGVSYYRIFQTVNAPGALIAGFTITNAYVSSPTYGGGVYLDGGVLSNCIVAGNVANNYYGGGVACMSGTVTHCRFYGNTAAYGGGIYCRTGVVAHCRMEENYANYGAGAGLYYDGVITDSVICGNQAASGGGGIYSQNCTGAVYNCAVYSNFTPGTRGGGLYVNNSGVRIENSSIHDNRTGAHGDAAFNGGGGIWASAPSTQVFLMRNCLLFNNYSYESGGGIYLYSYGNIENCTIVSNYAAYHSGLLYGGGGGMAFYCGTTTATVQNCIVQFNDCAYGASNWLFRQTSSATYNITNCCIGWGASATLFAALPPPNRGGGNFGDDPLLVDTNRADWHLQSVSPCVNAGIWQDWMKGAVDLDGRRRLDWGGGAVDLGCYEFVPPGMLLLIR